MLLPVQIRTRVALAAAFVADLVGERLAAPQRRLFAGHLGVALRVQQLLLQLIIEPLGQLQIVAGIVGCASSLRLSRK